MGRRERKRRKLQVEAGQAVVVLYARNDDRPGHSWLTAEGANVLVRFYEAADTPADSDTDLPGASEDVEAVIVVVPPAGHEGRHAGAQARAAEIREAVARVLGLEGGE